MSTPYLTKCSDWAYAAIMKEKTELKILITVVFCIVVIFVYNATWFKKEFRQCAYWEDRVEETKEEIRELKQILVEYESEINEIENTTEEITVEDLRRIGYSEKEIQEWKVDQMAAEKEFEESDREFDKMDAEIKREAAVEFFKLYGELAEAKSKLQRCE